MASRTASHSQGSDEEEDNEDDHTIVNKPKKKGAKRRRNCGGCSSCLREDCGQCSSCKNMIKFGGNGRNKQRCVRRRCSPPTGNLITSFFNNKHSAADSDQSASSRENTSSPKNEKDTENSCTLVDRLSENSIMTETTNITRTDQPVSPVAPQLQPPLECCVSLPMSLSPLSSGAVMSQTVLSCDVTCNGKLTPQLPSLQEPAVTAVEKENEIGEKVTSGRKRKRSKSKCDDVNVSPISPDVNDSREDCCNESCSSPQTSTTDKEERTSDCLKVEECLLESPLPSLPVSERRSKRKAAIAADSKLTRVSNDADSISSSPLPQRTRKRRKKSFLNSSDEVDQEDNVTILSSASPSPIDKSACMILGADFFASPEHDSSPTLQAAAKEPLDETMEKVVPSTSSLSTGWAMLFRKPPPVKEDPPAQNINEEADSRTSGRQRRQQLTPSPRKCLNPKKNVFSPPRASPKRSSRASPKCSPLRGSPKRSSPLRRQLVGQASPQKNHSSLVFTSSSLSSRKQLSFGSTKMLDCAPFHSLVHIQQFDNPLSPVVLNTNQFGLNATKLSSTGFTNVSDSAMQLGTVTMATKVPHPQNIILVEDQDERKVELKEESKLTVDNVLTQIEQQHPDSAKVRETFVRYQQLTQSISASTTSEGHSKSILEQTHQQPRASDIVVIPDSKKSNKTNSTKPKKKKKQEMNEEDSFVCSIRITKRKRPGRIMVDRMSYMGSAVLEEEDDSCDSKKRRRSRRRSREASKEDDEQTIDDSCDNSKKRRRRSHIHAEQISNEEEVVLIERASNQKSRRKSQGEADVSIVEVSTIVARPSLGGEVWCDVYQPHRAEDVIGNQSAVDQLQSWLTQWKGKCQTDSKTNQNVQQNGNQSKPRNLPETEVSDDPDFRTTKLRPSLRLSSLNDSFDSADLDDDSREDAGLCPALLVCGPSGSGKTAAIMACAEQLSFKVLEVNSTQLRSRQYLLSTLREATQSHQVTGKDTTTSRPPTSHPLPPTSSKPAGLLSFFKSKSTKPEKKKDASLKTEETERKCSRDVSLATITVILLEEVDVVFDDELKAFWSVVYELLLSTKRPFILTANDPDFQLDYRFKKIKFNRPSCEEVSVNCQLLSLAHGYQLPSTLANQIAELLSCDLRGVFNLLQFWLARPHMPQSSSQPTSDIVTLSDKSLLSSILGLPTSSNFSCLENSSSLNTTETRREFDLLCRRTEQLWKVKERVDFQETKGWLDLLSSTRLKSPTNSLPSSVSTSPAEAAKKSEKSIDSHERCARTSNRSVNWRTLDRFASFSDAYSIIDSLPCSSTRALPLWWKTEPRSTLLDELPVHESVSNWATPYRSSLEACVSSCMQNHQEYQMDRTCDISNRLHAVHGAQMCCCEVFSVQNELSRISMAAECLPYLHIICRSEKHRQTDNTKRRFLHYLHHSHITVDAFDNFSSVGSFKLNSEPS